MLLLAGKGWEGSGNNVYSKVAWVKAKGLVQQIPVNPLDR